jgi:hypothetical protein
MSSERNSANPNRLLEGVWSFRRWYRSQSGLSRWLIRRGAILLLTELMLFATTALFAGDAGKALEIAIGTLSPFASRADWLAVPLAVLGWLLIPALAGAVVAVALENALKQRSDQQVEDSVAAVLKRLQERAGGKQ